MDASEPNEKRRRTIAKTTPFQQAWNAAPNPFERPAALSDADLSNMSPEQVFPNFP